MPELSIIIPTKNEEDYLPKLLKSIKSQSFKNYEIIIADNSSDKTRKIAEYYLCRVVKGGLPPIARNAGARASKGKILAFMDADIILPNKNFLKEAIKELKEKGLDVAGTYQKPLPTITRTGRFLDKGFYKIGNGIMKISQHTKKPAMQVCAFATRGIHNKIGGFDETLEFAEDADYCEKAKKQRAKFRILKKPGKVLISPRRFEGQRVKMALGYIKMNFARTFGKKHRVGKTRYFID